MSEEKVRCSDHKFLCVIIKKIRKGRSRNPGPNIEKNTKSKHSIPDNRHSTYHLTLHLGIPALDLYI